MNFKKNRKELKKTNYLIINQIKKQNYISIKSSKRLIPKTLKKNITTFKLNSFWNQSFDKNRLKFFVFWCFQNYGQNKTVKVLEILKHLGFQYATKAGLSLSIDDLIIPPTKSKLLIEAELTTRKAMIQYKNAQITNLERFQKIIETWHITSEKIKDDMIYHFQTTNIFNPLYMMAFSGARGNVSQVRQLVGMRGLMANPQGQILDFPIQSNFREGLTLTEYVISCYGARKGVVDTALRTANAGYLTRRLVDVAQHIIISNFDCGTKRGLIVSEMKQGNKLLFSLRQRLLGRVLAKDVSSGNLLIAKKNEEISDNLSEIIASFVKTVIIRSPLTCKTTQFICQRCYGWSLAEGKLVSVGETVGIIAAQSIGEPGTQLTMRTFHTGGVFAGELLDQLIAPFDAIIKYNIYIPGNMIRTPQGNIAFLTRIESQFLLQSSSDSNNKKYYTIPPYTILFIRNGESVSKNQLIAQLCTFSPSFKNSSNLIEYKIYSDLEGEIKSTNLKILKKVTEINDIMHQSLEWGYIWILSGKIYQLPFNSIDGFQFESSLQQKNYFFPIKGDFLTNSSILSKILWKNNIENIKLSFEQKTKFYEKFTTNKKLYLNNCNQINNQWLEKWKLYSETYCFKNLNKSIKKFNKNLQLSVPNSLINIYSQNLLLFLTIDKIRYKNLGYFLFFKKNIQNYVKENKNSLVHFNMNFIQKNTFNNYENQFFIPIALESSINQQNNLITQPRFFYQKLSNMFFEWFPNELNTTISSGLIIFSEIFLFKNKKQLQKKIKNKIKKTLKHRPKKNIFLNSKKFKQCWKYYLFCNYLKFYDVQQKQLFLNFFNNKNKIQYLNSNYSIIFFSFRPFIQCEKQKLSEFNNIKTNNSFINEDKLIKEFSLVSIKKQIGINVKNKYRYYRKIFSIEKQLFNNKIFQKIYKYKSNKYIRLFINDIKKNKLIKIKQKNNLKLLYLSEYEISGKLRISYLNKISYFVNKTKKTKKYKSLNPASFFYKILNIKSNNFLLKKKFYNKLQLIIFFKNLNKLQYNKFFPILSNNYLTKKINFSLNIDKNGKNQKKNNDFFQTFSNIYINIYNIPITYKKNDLFSYEFIWNQFYYINMKQIIYKQKFLMSNKFLSKTSFDASKEMKNIKNIKIFYSSFTYYIIKNQFRFAASFQEQSINQLENIYKKEIKIISNYNKYTRKLLFIKQLNTTFLSYFFKETNFTISKKNCRTLNIIDLVVLHLDYQNLFNQFDFKKLINQIQKLKNDLERNKKWCKNCKKFNYLQILFKQLIKFSNYVFNKKKKLKVNSLNNYHYKQKTVENIKFNNYTIQNSIYYKKAVPILLIKYKKKKTTLNSRSFHAISIFNHFLIRKFSKNKNLNSTMLITDKEYLINNQTNNLILKTHLIKLNSLNNIVLNYYFKLISFKWLNIESSLGKTKILNPIFLKRRHFSKFINKNIIIYDNKIGSNLPTKNISPKFNLIQQNQNKQKKKSNKNFKNKILKKSEEKLLLYSRFSLVSKEYLKVSKKQLSLLIFNSQQKIIFNTFNKLLKINKYFFSNLNNLSLLQKYLISNKNISFFNKKLILKKTIKLLTLKSFLNLKKLEINTNTNILSKKNYLQKMNQFIFYLVQNLFNSNLELFKNTRQKKFRPFEFKNYYGILTLDKKKDKYAIFQYSQKEFSKSENIVYLSKNSKIILNKKWQLFQNKKEFLITNQPGWICKPIKNKNILSDYLNISSSYNNYLIFKFLEKKLKFYNYIHFFHSISISYQFCEKKLTWFNHTFLKMIELVQNFLKYYKDNSSIFSLPFFNFGINCVKYNQHLKTLKNKKHDSKKINNYYWFVNKEARFLNMKKSNICIFDFTIQKNYQILEEKKNTYIDNIFCIVKLHEFVINNYQNLSYFSSTNLLFLSKKKLFKLFEQKNKTNIWWNNNGFILKSQYNSILLNKQKLSHKLISKFPNLEVTFEQYLNLPSNKLYNTLYHKNNCKNNYNKETLILSNKNKVFHYYLLSNSIEHNNFQKNNKSKYLKILTKNYKIFKSQKQIKIFRYFLGFSIPINFDFSFQSSHISWNFFPNSNLSNLKYEKKIKSTEFLTYLILKNQILNEISLNRSIQLNFHYNSVIFSKISNCIKILLRQPCIDWSAIQLFNMGYKKNNLLAPTKTLLLLSPQNYLNSNNPIALTNIYSGMKGEIIYSLKRKKHTFVSLNIIESKVNEKFQFTKFLLKSERSLFLTKSDQICFKFQNEIILNNEFNFLKKLNIFKNHKHIRSLKIFQIKSVKQIILIFKVLQKIHNNCQFINQSIKIDLGLFLFQGDLLNTFFIDSNIINKNINLKTTKIQKNYMKSIIVNHSGQIIHLNQNKLTLRKGQPIFFSPHCIFHSYNNDFIEQNKPVLSLPYQQLKTGDIVQGIPKIEQLFEARLTFAGKLEYDNLTNILEIIFQTYKNKLKFQLAVRRSIELIQMIIINSIQRIYRSQGVNISDKHLEVIVKQMTKKVEIIDSGQSGFLIGEYFDLDVVELWNSKLSQIKHVKYKPLILGISKASLQTDSFLSAASFQYTTRILSQAAFFKKRDFLKGLKENIIVGNIIPAGTGYFGNIEELFKIN